MTPTAPDARQSCSSRSNDNSSHRHKAIGCRPCKLVPHPEYLNSSNSSGDIRTPWETNWTGNKVADQTLMYSQCRSRYTHPFMAEYLTLSCQCRYRNTHPFMAEYLTLSRRMSGEGCKNHPMPVMRPTRMHQKAQMTARCITQHKSWLTGKYY